MSTGIHGWSNVGWQTKNLMWHEKETTNKKPCLVSIGSLWEQQEGSKQTLQKNSNLWQRKLVFWIWMYVHQYVVQIYLHGWFLIPMLTYILWKQAKEICQRPPTNLYWRVEPDPESGKVAFGVSIPEIGYKKGCRIPDHMSVFIAELVAVLWALRWVEDIK